MYHSVGDSASAAFRRWEVPSGAFAEQLGSLTERGYTITSLSDALANPRERQVAVTFEDGSEDFVTDALPVLADYGAGATLYVPTAFVGSRARWLESYDERELLLLDWPELTSLADRGIELGSHGHRHVELDVVPAAMARYDVTASMRTLTEQTGRRPGSFCYPFGYHSPTVRRIVASAGFGSACEVGYRIHRRSRSRFQVSRLLVGRSVGAAEILRLVAEGHKDASLAARRGLRAGWRAYRSVRWRLGVETA
jgi:peptidoglycan/xylan/chitin deacetylase (PgdA/CDA1 family)